MLLLLVCCSSKEHYIFGTIKVIFLPANYTTQPCPLYLEIIREFNAITRSIWFWRLQDATQMKLDVLSAMHVTAESWRLITRTTIKDCFMKCSFPLVKSAAGWVAQFTNEDYPICDSALEVCGVWSFIQVLDQHFLGHKKTRKWSYTTFLDALKRIASSHKIHASIWYQEQL
jgi:hypothetical protein